VANVARHTGPAMSALPFRNNVPPFDFSWLAQDAFALPGLWLAICPGARIFPGRYVHQLRRWPGSCCSVRRSGVVDHGLGSDEGCHCGSRIVLARGTYDHAFLSRPLDLSGSNCGPRADSPAVVRASAEQKVLRPCIHSTVLCFALNARPNIVPVSPAARIAMWIWPRRFLQATVRIGGQTVAWGRSRECGLASSKDGERCVTLCERAAQSGRDTL